MKNLKFGFAVFAIAIVLALYALYPTYKLYKVIPKQEEMVKTDTARAKLEKEKIVLHKKALHLGLDLVGGMYLVMQPDKSKLPPEEARDASDRALEVIRNRIDQYGVYEPVIQKMGERILIELPGVDRARAKNLIGKTALLEFKMLASERQTYQVLKAIDRRLSKGDTLKAEGALTKYIFGAGGDLAIDDRDYPQVKSIIKETEDVIPKDLEFLFGLPEDYGGRRIRRIYLLKKEPVITGAGLKDARPSPYQGSKPTLANTWVVNFTLKRKAARKFARITGHNVGKRMAIVLDRVVKSAPVIQERIPHGRGQITGQRYADEAKDLAIVLRSGALPAPLLPMEERSIGPTLGSDSIRKGVRAALIGAALVVLFMAIYYSLSGLLADFALFFNIFFLLAILSTLRATLTLPGLAGIALTIGMGVDANVLIFERIREELGLGKTVRAAISTGYSKAFITIIDANLTTLITALALYIFGTGPIRGFAITLSAGLIINIITAVYLTRLILEWILGRRPVKTLRI